MAYHGIHVKHTLAEKVKIWHRPNTFKSQHQFPDTKKHWQEIHCLYDNTICANFKDSVSKLTFYSLLILNARRTGGCHELPYFDTSFICTRPDLKQQTFFWEYSQPLLQKPNVEKVQIHKLKVLGALQDLTLCCPVWQRYPPALSISSPDSKSYTISNRNILWCHWLIRSKNSMNYLRGSRQQ